MTGLPKITRVRPVAGFVLAVWFDDGAYGDWTVDFSRRKGPMALPLHNAEFVARAAVVDGAVEWPNGFDASADFVREEMKAAGTLRGPSVAAE